VLSYRRAWLAAGWLLVGLIIYLSLTPHPPEPLSFLYGDKLEHAFAYGSVALWFFQIYLPVRSRVIGSVMLVGLGIGLEFVQGWTGYRHFEIGDMMANSVGVSIGFVLAYTSLGRIFILVESKLRNI
jgi:VanZ family protein